MSVDVYNLGNVSKPIFERIDKDDYIIGSIGDYELINPVTDYQFLIVRHTYVVSGGTQYVNQTMVVPIFKNPDLVLSTNKAYALIYGVGSSTLSLSFHFSSDAKKIVVDAVSGTYMITSIVGVK